MFRRIKVFLLSSKVSQRLHEAPSQDARSLKEIGEKVVFTRLYLRGKFTTSLNFHREARQAVC